MKRLLPVLIVAIVLAGILAVPASAASSTGTVTYTVQPGDTLAKIGRQFCTSWQEIYHLNRAVIGPNPNVLIPGTVLQVPNHCGGPVPPCSVYDHGPTLHARGHVHGNIYTVAYGDTTYSVSKRFGLTVDQLAAANGLANPNYIYGGQKLVIPGPGPCPPPPPPPPHKPFITITSPLPGALLPATFTVSGTGGGLFEGNVVVRAVNSAGQVLAEKPTTLQGVDGGMGGAGTYSVQLTVNVSQNTTGKIVAFSTSPKDGRIVASASVPVTFTPGTSQPFITITSPAAGAVLAATFTVSGTGGGLFEGNVVVRALDNAGQVLAEKATTLQGANVGTGGAGTYSVQLTVNVAANTPGKIVSYSPSPSGSGNLAKTSVQVTFKPGTSQPFITISSPAPGALLPATFTVSGTGGGLFEGALVVRAQNNAGQILAQQPTTLQGANVGAGGTGTYSVQLTVNVSQNTPGKIVAYAGSSSGSGVLAQAVVAVTFTPGSPAYKVYAPGQCKIQGKPNAPFYAYPGGPQTGYFGAGGTFDAARGAKVSGAYWYEINTDPGSGNPPVWVPTSSTISATAGCAF
jgi:LysM repeat protein